MDEDNPPDGASEPSDDAPEEEESDAGWYFDLPKGAWERQEAKNRELRQSVRRNMDTEPLKRDAFGARAEGHDVIGGEPPAPDRSAQHEDAVPPEDAGWWVPETSSADQPAEVEYSTEPHAPAELPLTTASHQLPGDGEKQSQRPPAGLFGDFDPAPWDVSAEEREGASPGELGPLTRYVARHDDSEPRDPAGDDTQATGEAPRSRWGEIFSEKASDGVSMLDSMRAWSQSPESDDAGSEPGSFTADTFRDEEEAPSDLPAAERPAHAAGDVAPLPIRIHRHEDDEPAPVLGENPSSRWDQMFGRKASDDTGMLDGMRAWATQPHEEEAEESPRVRLGAEPEDADESLFEPFAWEQDSPPSAVERVRQTAPESEPPRQGLIGRLFGKKKQPDVGAGTAQATSDWPPANDAPAGFTGDASFRDEDLPRGSWLGRADGDENRFADEDSERPFQSMDVAPGSQAPIDSPWVFEDEPDAGQGQAIDFTGEPLRRGEAARFEPDTPDAQPGETAVTSPQDLPSPVRRRAWSLGAGRGPLPPQEDQAWDPFATLKSEEEGWDPAPFDAATQDAPVDNPGDSAAVPAASLDEVGDDDPWRTVDAAESEEEIQWDPAPAAPPAPSSEVPETIPADDPWATYMAGREEDHADAVAAGERPETAEAPASPMAAETATEEAPDDQLSGDDGDLPAAAATAAAGASAVASFDSVDAEEPPEAKSTLWDSGFARVHDEQLEAETPAEDVPAAADDPWADIAQASGFEPGSSEIAVFRGTAHVEEALDRYQAEREAEEAVRSPSSDALPDGAAPSADASVDLPAWDDSSLEDDTVLRAFQAHAAIPQDHDDIDDMPAAVSDTEPVVFDDLLGEDADDIVAEASQQPVENKYFGRMQGWAPQRGPNPGERQPFPWETEAPPVERVRPPDASDAFDDEGQHLEGWSRVEEPPTPWSGSAVAAHGDAPSVRHKSRSRMLVREIVETGLLALLVFLAVRASFQNFKVDGLSMYPTLEDGEYLIVNKLAYAEVDMERLGNFVPFVDPGDDPTREVFGGPERGDIVVLHDPREADTDLIKRIIALPGETIEIVDGDVYINDLLLQEPYIKQEWHDTKPKIEIPPGYYFVMGDNRSNSLDSRNSDIGLISKDLIIGKAALTYWPRNKFGLAPNDGGDISAEDGRPVITTQQLED